MNIYSCLADILQRINFETRNPILCISRKESSRDPLYLSEHTISMDAGARTRINIVLKPWSKILPELRPLLTVFQDYVVTYSGRVNILIVQSLE